MVGSKPPNIRLLSYNIHGCIGRGGRYDAGAIMEVIRHSNADVIALQEVYDEDPEDRCFLQMLQQSSYHIQYGSTLRHELRGDYGNVLLSRWPLSEVNLIDISVKGAEPRGAIHARVDHPSIALQVMATHFGLSGAERYQQAKKIVESYQRVRQPTETAELFAFMSDFNEWRPHSRALSLVEQVFGISESIRTFPSRAPLFALDRIFVAPRRTPVSRRTLSFELACTASDHLPLVADIEFQTKPSLRIV